MKITSDQRKKYFAIANSIGRKESYELLKKMTGKESIKNISKDQMSSVLNEMVRMQKASQPKRYRRPLETESNIINLLHCALVIGHSPESPGAQNDLTGRTEYYFNDDLAPEIEKKVNRVRISRVYRRTYAALPGDINKLDPDFIVSLHCNGSDQGASGTEVLYYHTSEKGKAIAGILQEFLVACLGLRDRGLKPTELGENGGYLLKHTTVPCLIAEPFFITNNDDLRTANENLDALAGAYAGAIEEIARVLSAGIASKKQLQAIESMRKQAGLDEQAFSSFCMRIIKRSTVRTVKEAQAIMAALKRMTKKKWKAGK